MSEVDYDALDPGIRETVRRLRAAGFRTTDSGDGATKPERGEDGCALAVPNVAIMCASDALTDEARRLRDLLAAAGVPVAPLAPDGSGVAIQATYDPADESAVIMLTGLDDRGWP